MRDSEQTPVVAVGGGGKKEERVEDIVAPRAFILSQIDDKFEMSFLRDFERAKSEE